MRLVRPQDPFPDAEIARVFSIDHARAEKQALLEQEGERERRRYHADRILQDFDWYSAAALVFLGVWNVLAVIGLSWLVGRVLASFEAGVWL